MEINLIKGAVYQDNRGLLTFFNTFDMMPIRRFYIVENTGVDIVRAWQGHQKEQKWFYALEGSFKVILVKPDHWINPSESLSYQEYKLSSGANEILSIPAGFVNGFQALEINSKLLVYSDVTLEQSASDDFRYDRKLWYKW